MAAGDGGRGRGPHWVVPRPPRVTSTPLFCIRTPDTIRKMKNDFRKMEDEMDRLATNMAVITDFSARISSTLQDRHERITKLAGGRPHRVPGRAPPVSVGLGN